MEPEDLKARLKALAQDNKKRTKAAKLRDLYDDVEAALSAGVTRLAVHQELESYLGMSFQTFVGTLRRIRAKQSKVSEEARSDKRLHSNPATPTIQKSKEQGTKKAESPSSNPADISTIMGTVPDLQALAKASKGIKK
jgi:hypothetical protein